MPGRTDNGGNAVVTVGGKALSVLRDSPRPRGHRALQLSVRGTLMVQIDSPCPENVSLQY